MENSRNLIGCVLCLPRRDFARVRAFFFYAKGGSPGQPRPQGFSLKKWVGREIYFLREKPWGRGCHPETCLKT